MSEHSNILFPALVFFADWIPEIGPTGRPEPFRIA
jgi:hypothetical protein